MIHPPQRRAQGIRRASSAVLDQIVSVTCSPARGWGGGGGRSGVGGLCGQWPSSGEEHKYYIKHVYYISSGPDNAWKLLNLSIYFDPYPLSFYLSLNLPLPLPLHVPYMVPTEKLCICVHQP